MFEGPVTGNIPEVLDNGEVTDGTHVTAGQLALALTPYAQVTDLAVNTAASGNNAAAIRLKAGQQRAGAGNCAPSNGGGPGHHGSSIAALQSSLTTGLSNKADQSAFAAQLASRDASITALQGAKADATLLASYATNAALSASDQSALDAILAELAAPQLSGSGGVVNAPAWAGFTTWELVRGSNVVRNLHLGAPLSAALANGDDTLSITADCYSTAGTDAAITAALLAYYTSVQVDALLGDYRTGAAQDAETASAITAALLAYYTSSQVDALLGDYRTASAQNTQTQAAIAGALLAYRTGPDQDVFTTRSVLCKEARKGECSAKERAAQRSVLCKERALQRSVLRRGECSAEERALQRSVLCKEACSAKKRALQRRVLCKEACSAKKRALHRSVQRSVLCKEACSAKKRALQRSVLCKGACSAKTRKLPPLASKS